MRGDRRFCCPSCGYPDILGPSRRALHPPLEPRPPPPGTQKGYTVETGVSEASASVRGSAGVAPVITTLPLVTLHLTERCNSRCVSCDYWRHGRDDLSEQSVRELLP